MQIDLIPDASIASAPAGLTSAVQAAAAVFERDFPGNYTVNISYGWGTYDNIADSTLTNPNSGAFSLGGTQNTDFVSYSQLKSWLTADARSSAQLTAVRSLPASTAAFPGGASTFVVSGAEEKALGVFTGNGGALDGSIGFNVGDASSASDWEPAALCEICHALGWLTAYYEPGGLPSVADLYRYSAPGHYQWTGGQPAYFSVDGGNSDLADFATSFDYTLFPDAAANDPLRLGFESYARTLTSFDIEALSAIGFGVLPSIVTTPITAYSSTASGYNHFIDLLNFEASFPDLIAAFGTNQQAMQSWYDTTEPKENRIETFDGLDYVASYPDLISAYGGAGSMKAVQDDGASHYITHGELEGRTTTFNGLDYIASYPDLIRAFGADNDAGAYHYIEHGRNEGRITTFNGLDYIASYPDLIRAFGANELAGADHFIQHGYSEGRSTTFDGLDYIASYSDLIKAFGANEQAGAAHYIDNGFAEGRVVTFDGLAYIADYTDLMNAFGANNNAGATHYIDYGHNEGRLTTFNVGAYESAHPDLIGKFSSNDAFLTAYIDYYKAKGTFLT